MRLSLTLTLALLTLPLALPAEGAGDGRNVIDTEIVQLDLTGSSSLGPVTIVGPKGFVQRVDRRQLRGSGELTMVFKLGSAVDRALNRSSTYPRIGLKTARGTEVSLLDVRLHRPRGDAEAGFATVHLSYDEIKWEIMKNQPQ